MTLQNPTSTQKHSIRNRMRVLQSQGASSSGTSSVPGIPTDLTTIGRSPRMHHVSVGMLGGTGGGGGGAVLPMSRSTSADAAAIQQHVGDGVGARKARVTWSKEEERYVCGNGVCGVCWCGCTSRA